MKEQNLLKSLTRLWGLAACALLSACVAEVDELPVGESLGETITFSTYIEKGTRSVVADLPQLHADGFVVFANRTTTDWDVDGSTSHADFMYNQEVGYTLPGGEIDGLWTYTPLKHWLKTAKVSFFAYSPDIPQITPAPWDANGATVLTYETPSLATDQRDIIAAATFDYDQESNNGRVDFSFQHVLSKIGFKAYQREALDEHTTIQITKFEVNYMPEKVHATGQVHIDRLQEGTAESLWVCSPDEGFFTNATGLSSGELIAVNESDQVIPVNLVGVDQETAVQINADDAYLMLVPQEYDTGDLKIKLSYTVTTEDASLTSGEYVEEVSDVIIDVPTHEGGWLPNMQYVYYVQIGLKSVQLDAAIAQDWNDYGDINTIPYEPDIAYEPEANIYHINTPEGLDILNKITQGINDTPVDTRADISNTLVAGATISIDADMDMSLLGEDYNWKPMVIQNSIYGNGHTISNLKISTDSGDEAAFIKSITSDTEVVVSDLTLRNPEIKAIDGIASGFVANASNTKFDNCHVLDDYSADETRFAIQSVGQLSSATGFVGRLKGNCQVVNCTMQANVSAEGSAHAFGPSYRGTEDYNKFEIVGCCASMNKLVPFVKNDIFMNDAVGPISISSIAKMMGCGLLYGDASQEYDDSTEGFSIPGVHILFSYGAQEYALLKEGKIGYMNVAIENWYTGKGLDSPERLFSMTADEFTRVENSPELQSELEPYKVGLIYDLTTHTYHVSDAQGLRILNNILSENNHESVVGCPDVPNGPSYFVGTYDDISIDADIDMADLGDAYNWNPITVKGNIYGNNHIIHHLKSVKESGGAAFIASVDPVSSVVIKDLELRNPIIKTLDSYAGIAAGFVIEADKATFINCRVIDENYTDVEYFAVSSAYSAAGFVYATQSNCQLINCGVQANIDGVYGFGPSSRVESEDENRLNVVGCYVKTNKVTKFDEKNVFMKEETYDSKTAKMVGCAVVYGDASVAFDATDGMDMTSVELAHCYGSQAFAALKGELIAGIDLAIAKWHTAQGLEAPEKLYSLTADDFTLVDNTPELQAELQANRPHAAGILYQPATQTYHITTAEGLDVLNRIFRSTNVEYVVGCAEIPNGYKYGYAYDKVSIDADIDMADLGTEYNWHPMKLENSIYGNGHTIHNLKCVNYDLTATFIRSISSTDGVVVENLTLQDPICIGQYASGFVGVAKNTTFVNCHVVDTKYQDATHFAIKVPSKYSGAYAAGFVVESPNCQFIYCGVQANIFSEYRSAGFCCKNERNDSNPRLSNTFVGCYVKTNKIIPFNEKRVFTEGISFVNVIGCGAVYGDVSESYDATNGMMLDAQVTCSYGASSYAALKPGNIAAMDLGILNWYASEGLAAPKKLFSLTADDFTFVDNTPELRAEIQANRPNAEGISYHADTHTYHITTAEGLDVLNHILRLKNSRFVSGCDVAPNGYQYDGAVYDDISIDANIDMAELGEGYSWEPIIVQSNINGHGHTISNLKAHHSSRGYDGCASFLHKVMSESIVTIQNVTIQNPHIYSDQGRAAGFVGVAQNAIFKECFVIQDDYTDANVSAITATTDGSPEDDKYEWSAGFVGVSEENCQYINCGVQANVITEGYTHVAGFGPAYTSNDTRSNRYIGCYVHTNKLTSFSPERAFMCPPKSDKGNKMVGCGIVFGDTSEAYDETGGMAIENVQVAYSYGAQSYSAFQDEKIGKMDVALTNWSQSTGEDIKFFSLGANDFVFVNNTPALQSALEEYRLGLMYDPVNHTYYVKTAQGLDVLNKIFRSTNTESVEGCAVVPNGLRYDGTTYDNISIDADIDMDDMGDEYNWTPMTVKGNIYGNNHTIYNLTCTTDDGSCATFIKSTGRSSRVVVRDLELRNPEMIAGGEAKYLKSSGFVDFAYNTRFINCHVVDDQYSDPTHCTIKAVQPSPTSYYTYAAGFVCSENASSQFIQCSVQANVAAVGNPYRASACTFGPVEGWATLVGCYAQTNKIAPFLESGLFAHGNAIEMIGCGMLYGDESVAYDAVDGITLSSGSVSYSYGAEEFAQLNSGKIAAMNIAVSNWFEKYGMGNPEKLFSLSADGFVFVDNTSQLQADIYASLPYVEGIRYESDTHTYHVTTAKGLDVLNHIFNKTNLDFVQGLSVVPNGHKCDGVICNVSIDADIDMSLLGQDYQWIPMAVQGNIDGHYFTISNLRVEPAAGTPAAFIGSIEPESSSVSIQNVIIRNPSVKASDAVAAGFVAHAKKAVFTGCEVIQDDYTNLSAYAIESSGLEGYVAGFVACVHEDCQFVNCIVQANVSGNQSSGFGYIEQFDDPRNTCFVGCYVHTNHLSNFSKNAIFIHNEVSPNNMQVIGCGLMYGGTESYSATNGLYIDYLDVYGSYDSKDYAWLKGEKIATMNLAILEWYKAQGVDAPKKLYSLTANDFKLVEYTSALQAEVEAYFETATGIRYAADTDTYHITTAEGMDVLNNIAHGENVDRVEGVMGVPNVEGTLYNKISIDADIDMADLGESYRWRALKLKGNLDGNKHIISNLKYADDNGTSSFIATATGVFIKDLTIRNPVLAAANYTAGFAVMLQNARVERCYVIADNYSDASQYINQKGNNHVSGFCKLLMSSNIIIHCGVQANLYAQGTDKRTFFAGQDGLVGSNHYCVFVGCYVRTNNTDIMSSDLKYLFSAGSGGNTKVIGCAGVFNNASASILPTDHVLTDEATQVKEVTSSYVVSDYSVLKNNNYVQNMNTAVEDWYSAVGLGTPPYIFSTTLNGFALVPSNE